MKRRLLSIILTMLLIAACVITGGVTAKADPPEDVSKNSEFLGEAAEHCAENEDAEATEADETKAFDEEGLAFEADEPETSGADETKTSGDEIAEGEVPEMISEEAEPESVPEIENQEKTRDEKAQEGVPEEEPASEGVLGELDESGTLENGITWYAYSSGALWFSGSGSIPDYPVDDPPYYSTRDYVTNIHFGNDITGIGEAAFWGFNKVEDVNLPNSLTEIRARAFYGCSSLKEITIPGKVNVIGKNAFESCLALEKITFKGGAPSIGTEAFYGVTATAYYLPVDGWSAVDRKSVV